MHPSRTEAKFPQNQADRCVMCGLCLPHCPTYMKTGDENESPRGRIALMRAMARDEVPLNAKLESHLAGCLTCRACENVCPSMVEFGALIEAGRSFIETRRLRPVWSRLSAGFLLEWLVAHPRNMRLLASLLRLYQRSGLQRLLRQTGLLRLAGLAQLDAALPALGSQKQWKTVYPARGETRARIAFFTGCVGSIVDRETLAASIRVLNVLGYEVHLPTAQTCCGALHLHAGRREQAEALMRRNIAAFTEAPGLQHGGSETVAIVYVASGCGATLAEYPRHLPDEPQVRPFAARVTEISRFIAEAPWPEGLEIQPLAKTIAVQDPCSLRNVIHGERWPYALLDKIPGVRIEALAGNHVCCGGAGAYPLTQPQMANRLRADKLEYIRHVAPDMIVSANIGCALHLAAGLNQENSDIEVTHPVVVLERQLRLPQTPT
ncbi:MAG: (Fe-S)-binding protein [Acidiferrobacterales bacterium]